MFCALFWETLVKALFNLMPFIFVYWVHHGEAMFEAADEKTATHSSKEQRRDIFLLCAVLKNWTNV